MHKETILPELQICNRLGMKIVSDVVPLSIDSSIYLGRSATILSDHTTGKDYFFHGASVKDSSDLAYRVSKFELLERLLAMPQFHVDTISNGKGFPTFKLLSGRIVSNVAPEEVLLFGKQEMGTNSNKKVFGKTANGLALHTDIRLAIEHAVLELIERHLACKLWYDSSIMVSKVGEDKELPLGYTLRRFTVMRENPVPFVLSVIEGKNVPTFLCGSAVRTTLSSAIKVADLEALMMLENILKECDMELGNTLDTLEVARTLIGDSAITRRNHFNTKITPSVLNLEEDKQFTLEQIIEESFVNPDTLTITRLLEFPEATLVRALCPEAWEKRHVRKEMKNSGIPIDPYC